MQTIEFSGLHVEEENSDKVRENVVDSDMNFKHKIVDHDIIQLPNNHIPKGIVPLEKLFDQNELPKSSLLNSQQENTQDCNIGATKEIKKLKISEMLHQH